MFMTKPPLVVGAQYFNPCEFRLNTFSLVLNNQLFLPDEVRIRTLLYIFVKTEKLLVHIYKESLILVFGSGSSGRATDKQR